MRAAVLGHAPQMSVGRIVPDVQPAPRPLSRVSGRSPQLLVGGVVLAVAAAAFTRVPLLPDIGKDLGLSVQDLGLITTAFALGRLAMDLPAGRLVDALPPARGLAACGIGVAMAGVLLGTAQSFAGVLLAMVVLGAASALTNATGMTVFATSAAPARRGVAMAGFTTALLAGQSVGPVIGGTLGVAVGWRWAQGSTVAIGIAVLALCLLAPGARLARRHAVWHDDAAGSRPRSLTPVETVVLSSVPFAIFFALGALPQTLIPLIGARELGLSVSVIGVAIGAGGVARFVGAYTTGRLSDRVSRKAALIPNLVVMAAGATLLALSGSTAAWLTAILVIAFASSGIGVAATMIVDRVPADRAGRRLASFRFAGDAGLLAGPAVATVIYQHSGRTAATVTTAAVLGACATASAMLLPGGRAQPGEPLVVQDLA